MSQRDRDVLQTVKDAISQNNVLLAYQPVVAATNPDEPIFYEALARVRDRTGRIIPAEQFIDAIETHETGRLLDCRSLQLGLDALRRHPGIRLAVNMSARSIGYRKWVETLESALFANRSIASRLILEITESSAMVMPDVVRMFMSDLQKRGVTFALDDFGAGYTSFRYLRDFYFDILKIDGQFIRGIHKDPDNQVLTEALLSVGQHFDMFTVAESVETSEDAAYLDAIGMDCMQGFHFGVPTLEPEFESAETLAQSTK